MAGDAKGLKGGTFKLTQTATASPAQYILQAYLYVQGLGKL